MLPSVRGVYIFIYIYIDMPELAIRIHASVFGVERSGKSVGLTRRNKPVHDGHELNIHLFLVVVDMVCQTLFRLAVPRRLV